MYSRKITAPGIINFIVSLFIRRIFSHLLSDFFYSTLKMNIIFIYFHTVNGIRYVRTTNQTFPENFSFPTIVSLVIAIIVIFSSIIVAVSVPPVVISVVFGTTVLLLFFWLTFFLLHIKTSLPLIGLIYPLPALNLRLLRQMKF